MPAAFIASSVGTIRQIHTVTVDRGPPDQSQPARFSKNRSPFRVPPGHWA